MSHRLHFRSELGALFLQAEADFGNRIITLSGENGSGKTTLLRTIAGLSATHGTLMVHGRVWLDSALGFALPPQDRRIGCMWNNPALLPWLTVAENITLGTAADALQATDLAEALQIDHLLQRKPSMLSTGEAQRIALARAICRQPVMLLLDEPFSAQAPKLRNHLRAWLRSWQQAQQCPVWVVSHDMDDVVALGGYHWRMREGRLWTAIDSIEQQRRSIA